MKAFNCDACGSLVFFENVKCVNCGHPLGFVPSSSELRALEPAGNGTWRKMRAGPHDSEFRLCQNYQQYQVCNWLVPSDDPDPLCRACRLNELIPDLSLVGNHERWRKLEVAKHYLVYAILRLNLPLTGTANCPDLHFSFIGDTPGSPPSTTGHLNGLIVINIAEADDAERERRRVALHEPIRTLLGHLRHEVAHWYWDRLIAKGKWLPGFRNMFGDESADYKAALQHYYQNGPPADWQASYVSAYGSSHPWEDWAETWAHYFHIIDMTDTAESYGMTLSPTHPAAASMSANPGKAFDSNASFSSVLKNWLPLTCALNAINRGMGLPDVYPFALSDVAIEKLQFIHKVITDPRHSNHSPVNETDHQTPLAQTW